MEEKHKFRIQSNIDKLIDKCWLEVLLQKLESKKVFPKNMIHHFQRNSDGARQLFIEIQKRGPKAFEHLVSSLIESNQVDLVNLLDPQKEFKMERATHGCQVFIMPNYSNDEAANNIFKQTEPVEIKVTRSANFDHDEPKVNKAPVYFTRSKCRGFVKIINVLNVIDHKPRKGSSNDVFSLTKLFEQIGMTVDVSVDLTGEEIKSELEEFVKRRDLKRADIAILVIMSHGGINSDNEEFFYGKDKEPVTSKYVEELFNNANCLFMQGKPKIIIFQFCRGTQYDYGVERHPIETDGTPKTLLPISTDLLIINSTLRYQKSHRDIYVGAWYIQIFCYVFMNHCHNTDIEGLLKQVQVIIQTQRGNENSLQTSESINRAFNLCYLNPGIYMDQGKIKHFPNN